MPPAEVNADKEIAAEINQLEKDINELKATYELYFMGIEKLEPQPQRDIIKSKLRRWQEMRPRNTALKFKIQQLKARLVSLENYWERTNRQREAGNYRRDQAKVQRREAERRQQELTAQKLRDEEKKNFDTHTVQGPAAPRPSGHDIDSRVLAAGHGSSASHSAAHPASRPSSNASMARPRASSAADLTEPKLQKLYQTYVGARKRCGEKVDLRYEDMAAALRKQVPRLMKETGAKSVEFKVVIRSGRAVLKALPKHNDS